MIVKPLQRLEGHQMLGVPNIRYAEGPLPHGDGTLLPELRESAERPVDSCVPRDSSPHPREGELSGDSMLDLS